MTLHRSAKARYRQPHAPAVTGVLVEDFPPGRLANQTSPVKVVPASQCPLDNQFHRGVREFARQVIEQIEAIARTVGGRNNEDATL
jgi:hypothetical protein